MSPAQFLSFSPDDDGQPWTHWRQDVFGDWKANFYTTTEPYMRCPRIVTGCGPNVRERLEEMRAQVDAKAADDGLVTFDKLPALVQEYWAEADATWLVESIVRHVAERDA